MGCDWTPRTFDTGAPLRYMHGANCVGGPVGEAAIKLLAYDQRTMNAVREIRKVIQPWGDNDFAQIIRAALDRWDV